MGVYSKWVLTAPYLSLPIPRLFGQRLVKSITFSPACILPLLEIGHFMTFHFLLSCASLVHVVLMPDVISSAFLPSPLSPSRSWLPFCQSLCPSVVFSTHNMTCPPPFSLLDFLYEVFHLSLLLYV